MAFCGYDPEMSVGLKKFGRGVANSTLKKAGGAGHSIEKQIEQELAELKVLLAELERRKGTCTDVLALIGLTLLCQAIFESADKECITDEGSFRQHFEQAFARYGELVYKLEDGYQAAPPGTIVGRIKAGVTAAID